MDPDCSRCHSLQYKSTWSASKGDAPSKQFIAITADGSFVPSDCVYCALLLSLLGQWVPEWRNVTPPYTLDLTLSGTQTPRLQIYQVSEDATSTTTRTDVRLYCNTSRCSGSFHLPQPNVQIQCSFANRIAADSL